MSDTVYHVVLGGVDTIVRMGDVVVPSLQVTPAIFGTIQIQGGIPGPAGPPGLSTYAEVLTHISDTTPHPAYDDLPSMVLIFENGLV
jgi:hypothetical protein